MKRESEDRGLGQLLGQGIIQLILATYREHVRHHHSFLIFAATTAVVVVVVHIAMTNFRVVMDVGVTVGFAVFEVGHGQTGP